MAHSHIGGASASLVDTAAIPVRSTAGRNGLLGGVVGVSLISVFFWPDTSFFFLPAALVVVALQILTAAPDRQAECPWCKTVIAMARHRMRCSTCQQRIVVRNDQFVRGAFDVVVGRFGPR
jgi:hypothetical protein